MKNNLQTKICDLDKCPLSERNGAYGGNSGEKEGILIDDEPWIVKYPGTMRREATASLHFL